PRYGDPRGTDHVRFDPARIQPTRQPEAIATGFEGQCNPRDLFTGPDRFIAPAMQQAKKPFRTRFQFLLRLTLNAGKHPGNQPARLAQLDDGNDCAILVQGDEGPAQVIQLGHSGHSVSYLPATMVPSPSLPAPYHLAAGANGIRTLGPAGCCDHRRSSGDRLAAIAHGRSLIAKTTQERRDWPSLTEIFFAVCRRGGTERCRPATAAITRSLAVSWSPRVPICGCRC